MGFSKTYCDYWYCCGVESEARPLYPKSAIKQLLITIQFQLSYYTTVTVNIMWQVDINNDCVSFIVGEIESGR